MKHTISCHYLNVNNLQDFKSILVYLNSGSLVPQLALKGEPKPWIKPKHRLLCRLYMLASLSFTIQFLAAFGSNAKGYMMKKITIIKIHNNLVSQFINIYFWNNEIHLTRVSKASFTSQRLKIHDTEHNPILLKSTDLSLILRHSDSLL